MKVNFSLFKIYAGVSLLIVVSLLQNIKVIDHQVLSIITPKTIKDNPIIYYDNNIKKFNQFLHRRGIVSYIGMYGDDYANIVGTVNSELARFSLIPVILSTNPKEAHSWAVGNFPPGVEPKTAYVSGIKYSLLKGLDSGFCLYKKDQ
jgi:hypothetical protein